MGRYSSMLGGCTESLLTNLKCIHHWKIEPSNGPTSHGICVVCQMEKDFLNSIYSKTRHITLEKDHSDAKKEKNSRWNAY